MTRMGKGVSGVKKPTLLAQTISDRLHRKTGVRYTPEIIQLILDQSDVITNPKSDRLRGMNPTRYDPKLGRHVEMTDEELDNG